MTSVTESSFLIISADNRPAETEQEPKEEERDFFFKRKLEKRIAEIRMVIDWKPLPFKTPVASEEPMAKHRLLQIRRSIRDKRLLLEEKKRLLDEMRAASRKSSSHDGISCPVAKTPESEEEAGEQLDRSWEMIGEVQNDPITDPLEELTERRQQAALRLETIKRRVAEYRLFLVEKAREFYSKDPAYADFDVRDSWLEIVAIKSARTDGQGLNESMFARELYPVEDADSNMITESCQSPVASEGYQRPFWTVPVEDPPLMARFRLKGRRS